LIHVLSRPNPANRQTGGQKELRRRKPYFRFLVGTIVLVFSQMKFVCSLACCFM